MWIRTWDWSGVETGALVGSAGRHAVNSDVELPFVKGSLRNKKSFPREFTEALFSLVAPLSDSGCVENGRREG